MKSKYDKLYIVGELLLLLESAKKYKFAKIDFFENSSHIVKMFAKKMSEKMIKRTFLKSQRQCHFKYARNLAKFDVWLRKIKNVTGCMQKM